MKLAVFSVLFVAPLVPLTADEPRVKAPRISSDNTPEAIARAKQQGAETALVDIKARRPVILHFGIPWSAGKPLVDDTTGLRVQIVAGCTVTGAFAAEVNAYNDTIRAWHAENKATTRPK
ncbi:MAG: hypothetical protein M3463_06460 [Verrucomicrobiota bacterium]|nr:hypothetical protein [Verrucomicrobiota bacterium]